MDDRELNRLTHLLGHELLTPLSGVSMLLTSLRPKGGNRAGDPIHQALDATQRAVAVTRAFVAFFDVTLAPAPREPVDLADLLQEVRAGFRDHDIELQRPLPSVVSNALVLRRVFNTLIDNAVRYTLDSQPNVTVAAERENGSWRVDVADRGVGMSAADCERVLHPMTRLHPYEVVPGAGFSLATAVRLLASVGARVALRPRQGGGTVASVSLPA